MTDRFTTPIQPNQKRRKGNAAPAALSALTAISPHVVALIGGVVPLAARSVAMGGIVASVALMAALPARPARADGTLNFTIRDARTREAISGAIVTLEDPTGEEFRVSLTADASGQVTSRPLAAHPWRVIVTALNYTRTAQDVTVVDGAATDVEILLTPVPRERLIVSGVRELIRRDDTTNTYRRSRDFFRLYPVTAGNRQSVPKALRAIPGFVENSISQAHARGDQDGKAQIVDGFLLPQFLQGRLAQLLPVDALDTLAVTTGGLPPEFGADSAAILNYETRAIPSDGNNYLEYALSDGGYDSNELFVTAAASVVPRGSRPNADGIYERRIGYVLNGSQRYTNVANESPQPNVLTANNQGRSETLFGKVEFRANRTESITGLFDFSYGRTGNPNRTGLDDGYDSAGQGFGFGGLRPDNSIRNFPFNKYTGVGGFDLPLTNQADARQDIYQKDVNSFGALQYRKATPNGLNALLQVGFGKTRQAVLNNTRTDLFDLRALPSDDGVEFRPTVVNDYDQTQAQGDFSLRKGKHTLRFGGLYANLRGEESHQLIPGSQTALNALAGYGDARLLPDGAYTGRVDALGNPEYVVNPNNGAVGSPVVNILRKGYYASAYVGDTWRITSPLTANFGFRYDIYENETNQAQRSIKSDQVSPRLNFAYVLPSKGYLAFLGNQPTILRASYNQTFTRPTLGQGAYIGDPIPAETADVYELDMERQFGENQVARFSIYNKEIENFTNVGALVQNSQIAVYSLFNQGRASANGFEVSYEFIPRGPGFNGYLSYSNSRVQSLNGGKRDNVGDFVPVGYLDHDQRNTLSTGAAYRFADGTEAGLNVIYNSGLYSSDTSRLGLGGDDGRQGRAEVNLRLATRPNFAGRAIGFEFLVENLLNSKERINFRSSFEGTRFQTGRRITVGAFGRF